MPNQPAVAVEILSFASALAHWHQQHQFCGYCGKRTKSLELGTSRQCQDSQCANRVFPRTDPAVIMTVSHPQSAHMPQLLMGRQSQWAAGVYSVLAGFVDPGESLEMAVRREVKEEAGIEVGQVDYAQSQAWPYPCSLMVGFHAQALSAQIQFDPKELSDAKWFDLATLAQFGDWSDDQSEYRFPRADSIAYQLIQSWIHTHS